MTELSQHYALVCDDGVWYHLPETRKYPTIVDVLTGFDEPMVQSAERPGWWLASSVTASAVIVWRESPPIVGYRLKEGGPRLGALGLLQSDVFPEELTPEEFAARLGEFGRDLEEEVSAAERLYRESYEPVRGEPSVERVTVDLSDRIELEGAPPTRPPAGSSWTAKLPWELRTHSEYLHLFPGYLSGFRDAVAKRLGQIPWVSAYAQSDFTVFAPIRGATTELVKAGYLKPPAYRIEGANLGAAAAEWEERLRVYVTAVERATHRGSCSRCGGTGEAPAYEPDEARVRALAERFRKAAGPSKALKAASLPWARIAVEFLDE